MISCNSFCSSIAAFWLRFIGIGWTLGKATCPSLVRFLPEFEFQIPAKVTWASFVQFLSTRSCASYLAPDLLKFCARFLGLSGSLGKFTCASLVQFLPKWSCASYLAPDLLKSRERFLGVCVTLGKVTCSNLVQFLSKWSCTSYLVSDSLDTYPTYRSKSGPSLLTRLCYQGKNKLSIAYKEKYRFTIIIPTMSITKKNELFDLICLQAFTYIFIHSFLVCT